MLHNYSRSDYSGKFRYYMAKVGNDWYIDSLNTLGFILQVPYMRINLDLKPENNIGYTVQGNDTTEMSTTSTRTRTAMPQYTANLNYTHTFSEQLERELTVNVDYNRYETANSNLQQTSYTDRTLDLDINSRQKVDICSAKMDFQTKFWQTGMLECGVKYAHSSTDNHMTTDSMLNALPLPQAASDFLYREHVAAAYITAGKQFGDHWSVKLGMRGEYTWSRGDWMSAGSLTKKSYFNPFPTAFVGYTSSPVGKLQQPVAVSMSYSRRIKRPDYYMLNPFVTNYDAYSSQVGNTALTPEFNNDVELHFSWTQYLNLTFNFAHTQDMFNQRIFVFPDGTAQMKWVNFGTCTTHGGNISLTELPLVPKYGECDENQMVNGKCPNRKVVGAYLALTVNAGWYHHINRSYETVTLPLEEGGGEAPLYNNRSHYGYIGGTLSAYLPKDWTLTLDGNWSSPMTTGYDRQQSTCYLSFGMRKMWMKKGLVFNLNMQDLLRSMRFRSDDLGQPDGYASWAQNTFRQQRVMLSVTWMFGRHQQHKNRKVGNMDELNRLGGGDGISAGK